MSAQEHSISKMIVQGIEEVLKRIIGKRGGGGFANSYTLWSALAFLLRALWVCSHLNLQPEPDRLKGKTFSSEKEKPFFFDRP